MYMIVGLGNPGDKYTATKHNVGFWAIDAIADEMNVLVEKKQCQALTGTGMWHGKKVLLVKPQTFMNLSGQAVIELLNYYADQIDDLLIIHDDLDLEPGMLRFKQNGSSGGHNGIKSIAQHLNSNEFDRLKRVSAKAAAIQRAMCWRLSARKTSSWCKKPWINPWKRSAAG